jgi:hypothetical protein
MLHGTSSYNIQNYVKGNVNMSTLWLGENWKSHRKVRDADGNGFIGI